MIDKIKNEHLNKQKVDRATNIVLAVLAVFIFLNIAIFMWFLVTKLPK